MEEREMMFGMSPNLKGEMVNIKIENTNTIYKTNFEGRAEAFNALGKKYFNIRLSEECAAWLASLGYNVKRSKAREEGDWEEPYLKIVIHYSDGNPAYHPKVYVKEDGCVNLVEYDWSTISIVDDFFITNMDVVFRPYHWEQPTGANGITPYAEVVYITKRAGIDPFKQNYLVGE